MKIKTALSTGLIAIVGGLIAVFAYSFFSDNQQKVLVTESQPKVRYAHFPPSYDSNSFDFTYAAELSIHTVVHVKTKSLGGNYTGNPLYDFFFGDRYDYQPKPRVGFGSGVIISEDGYIVTNNHVIESSDEIQVILNDRREYTAEIVGSDPSTDLAVLKIEEKGLPYIRYGNSDHLKVGEWVLAVGNPYNLTSTVTAGIVSAKARDLGILKNQYAINSFIQTDAAVNPGNSGGALVNLKGELVGINTAIASNTGSYAGNSFAVPVSIVKKVVADLIEFGQVQRAIIGVSITDVTAELAEDKDLEKIEGVYISGLRENGAAKEAGIEVGDIILNVNGVQVNNTSELQEQVSRYRPGDEISLLVKRDGKKKQFDVTLRNMQGTTDIVKRKQIDSLLGATLEPVSEKEKSRLRIRYGIKVTELTDGKFRKAGIKEGFIITQVNNSPVRSVEDLKQVIESTDGGVYIEGVYPNGIVAYYAFGI